MLFYVIGYDIPWSKNPALTEPLLTPLIIWLIVIMAIAAVAVTAASVIISLRKGNNKIVINNIPFKKTNWGITIILIALLCISFGLGNTDAIMLNGKAYDNGLWLRIGDMLIITSFVLLLIAFILMILSSVITKKS